MIHVTSRAVIVKDNYILLAYDPQKKPRHYYELGATFYYLPGGHIDFKEHALDAIIREIMEETGYKAKCQSFLGVIEYVWHSKQKVCHTHEINLIFKLDIDINSCKEIKQKEQHVAMKWVNLNDLNEVDLRPTVLKKHIPIWLEKDTTDIFITQK